MNPPNRGSRAISTLAASVVVLVIIGLAAGVTLYGSVNRFGSGITTGSSTRRTSDSTAFTESSSSQSNSTTSGPDSTTTSSTTAASTSQTTNETTTFTTTGGSNTSTSTAISTSSSSSSTVSTESSTTSTVTLPAPSPGATLANLTYCVIDGVQLQMDLYYPPSTFSPPYPLVVFVHGGGWTIGDKQGVRREAVYGMTGDGFVVGSVNYRLAPQYPFPAQIEDVKCSIRFLRANAGALEIDPARIGVMGTSAGGQIASLLGVTGRSSIWDVGDYTSVSSEVSAVAVVSGPENLTASVNDSTWIDAVTAEFGDSYTLEHEGSPVVYASSSASPFLLEYGYNDTVVPYLQGVEFDDVLRAVGVNSTLILVNNAGHALVPINSSLPEDPPLNDTRQDMVNFFVQRLHPVAGASPAGAQVPTGGRHSVVGALLVVVEGVLVGAGAERRPRAEKARRFPTPSHEGGRPRRALN